MSIEAVASALRSARSVVVLTGAGISAESGLRTFRGNEKDMGSLWKSFDAMRLATPEAFEADPEMVTKWYDWRRRGCLAAEANAGHLALAEMEKRVMGKGHGSESRATGHRSETGATSFTLLTQNVDRLHQKAGSVNVVELHGTIIEWRCVGCGRKSVPGPEEFAKTPAPAACCEGELLRPDVVWFGEALPVEAIEAAEEAVAGCDLFLSIGTSAVVYPAAGYIQAAAAMGAKTVEINAEETPISGMVDWTVRGKAGEVLPRIVRQAWGT